MPEEDIQATHTHTHTLMGKNLEGFYDLFLVGSKMAQWLKVLTAKPEDVDLIIGM